MGIKEGIGRGGIGWIRPGRKMVRKEGEGREELPSTVKDGIKKKKDHRGVLQEVREGQPNGVQPKNSKSKLKAFMYLICSKRALGTCTQSF